MLPWQFVPHCTLSWPSSFWHLPSRTPARNFSRSHVRLLPPLACSSRLLTSRWDKLLMLLQLLALPLLLQRLPRSSVSLVQISVTDPRHRSELAKRRPRRRVGRCRRWRRVKDARVRVAWKPRSLTTRWLRRRLLVAGVRSRETASRRRVRDPSPPADKNQTAAAASGSMVVGRTGGWSRLDLVQNDIHLLAVLLRLPPLRAAPDQDKETAQKDGEQEAA